MRYPILISPIISCFVLIFAYVGLSQLSGQTDNGNPGIFAVKYHNAIEDPLHLQKSQVYDIYGEFAMRGTALHAPSLRKMFNTAIRQLTGLSDESKAWRQYIGDNERVALVFCSVGERELGTNSQFCGSLLQTLYRCDYHPENFLIVGLKELPDEAKGTMPYLYGWQDNPVDFYSDSDDLALWLNQVDAIIDIPTIMDDNIFGMRGCLTNLSWPLIKSPARLYVSGGDPFICDIYRLPQIRGKVRLHIANSLRILCYGGPEVLPAYIKQTGSILVSTDPVALDRVALELIRRERRLMPLPRGADLQIDAGYLETAEAMGLGYRDLNFIDYQRMAHDKK